MSSPRFSIQTTGSTRLGLANAAFTGLSLNALDHFEVLFNMEIVYLYGTTLNAARLRESLRAALDAYPCLCGQLVRGPDRTLVVQGGAPGVLFSEAECASTLAAVQAGINDPPGAGRFITRINPLTLKKPGIPLATVQLTRMAGGGSALGICMSHALADAGGFFQFITHWASVDAGLSIEAPLHDRGLPQECGQGNTADAPADGAARECAGFRRHSVAGLGRIIAAFALHQHRIVCRVLRFSDGQVQAIARAAGPGCVSRNDALCAHLWQFCARLGGTCGREACRLIIPADIRRLSGNPRAAHYFGNAVAHLVVAARGEELAAGQVRDLAMRCRSAITELDAARIARQMRWLARQERSGCLYRVTAAMNCFAGDVLIAGLTRLPIHAARFEGAAPLCAAVPVIPAPWVLQLLPDPQGEGALSVNAFLPQRAAGLLAQDEWQQALYEHGDR